MAEKSFADRVAAVHWHKYPQPEWNEPDAVARALVGIWNATDAKSSVAAYDRFLYAIGNNHAGTYCPVVRVAMPFLAEILKTGSPMAQKAVMEVLGDLYGSFTPECTDSEAARVLEDQLRRSIRALREVIEGIADGDGANAKPAGELIDLLD